MPRPPLSQLIVYALGQLGWSLASFGAANLLVYFYLPPDTGQPLFPTFIYQGAVLGIATIIGLVNFGGRLFDAITDPLVAQLSDRLNGGKLGKRKTLLAISAVPFALLSFAVFYPPFSSVLANGAYLVVVILLYYFFFTLYLIPYTALISELGHHPADRLRISTIISITWAVGFLVGSNAYALQARLEEFMSSVAAFQWTVAAFAGLSLLFMLVPVFFLRERTYAQPVAAATGAGLGTVWAERNYRLFLISDLFYWLALTFIQIGVGYYVTLLFGLEKEQATTFMAIAFMVSFLFYWPINAGARRWGKRIVMLLGFGVFAVIFLCTALVDLLPGLQTVFFYGLAVLCGFPLAAFGILPNALIADEVTHHHAQGGGAGAALFFAVRTLVMKFGISLANLLFPSLLLLGKSIEQPTGVRVALVLALLFSLLGMAVFSRYREVSTPAESAA